MEKVKVYGERNSGTIYLEWLLVKNLEVGVLDDYIFGWKHRVAPGKEEIEEMIKGNVPYICLVKNPYSWLLSMHKRPYHHESLRKVSFTEFLKYSYGDYRNPIVMWNKKNRSYVEMGNYSDNHIVVKYEDLLKDPKQQLTLLSEKFGFQKPGLFKNIHNLLTNSHGVNKRRFHADYYIKEAWRKKLNNDHIKYINQFLDEDLLSILGYNKI